MGGAETCLQTVEKSKKWSEIEDFAA